MSRWRSPEAAAKRAARAAKEAEKDRKEKRNSRLMIIGVAMVSIGLIVADVFWLKARAQRRREEHMRTRHHQMTTNSPATESGQPGVPLKKD